MMRRARHLLATAPQYGGRSCLRGTLCRGENSFTSDDNSLAPQAGEEPPDSGAAGFKDALWPWLADVPTCGT